MSAAAEAPFVYAFAALLAGGAVVLLFVPLLRHVWLFSASRGVFAAVIGGLFMLSVAAILVVTTSFADPALLVPIAGVTVGLRVASPTLLYGRVRDRLEARRAWPWLRALLGIGFLAFAGALAYALFEILAGRAPTEIAAVSEQLAMASGASTLIVRMAYRVRPHDTAELWPVWMAATAFALAFVIVAPYAFPAFATAYVVSGLVGWSLGAVVIWYVD